MGLKTHTISLSNATFTVTQWVPETALRKQIEIAGIFGPGISGIITGATDGDGDPGRMILGLTEMCKDNPDKIMAFIKDIICDSENVSIKLGDNGTQRMNSGLFNLAFNGALFDIYKLFFFILKANFADFLPENLVSSFKEKLQVIPGTQE